MFDNLENFYFGLQLADNHGNYFGECVSYVKRYAQERLNVPNADSVLYVKDDLAKNMFLNPTADTLKFFDLVTSPQRGDIAVYNGSYGDVAVCLGDGRVIGQLGYPVYGKVAIRPIGSPLGYLRRKGVPMSTADEIASVRHDLLNELWNGAGVDPNTVKDENAATQQALGNIDQKNKLIEIQDKKIAELEATVGGALSSDQAASLNRIDSSVQWLVNAFKNIFRS